MGLRAEALRLAAAPLAILLVCGATSPASVAAATADAAVRCAQEQDRPAVEESSDDSPEKRADRLATLLNSDASDQVIADQLRPAFDAFIERMDAFDGERSLRLARGMFRRSPAVWSAFCLEGALRRSAGARSDSSSAAFREADQMLASMLGPDSPLTATERVDVVQRRAILAAGFGDRAAERMALGRALSLRGTDGLQISGLAALANGDTGRAASLFAALLDRGRHAAVGGPVDEAAADAAARASADVLPAWALRGHGLAALAELTR